ncbi:hypothetical protein HRG84_13540 [Flavisolibacter sp. BT320]|nr:hypothetical protein [Flavisolibacter longurius]
MLWKRKNKVVEAKTTPLFLASVLTRFNNQLVHWAMYLQRRSNSLPPRKLKLLFALFCLLLVSSSAYVIITSLKEKTLPFRITPIQVMPLEGHPSRQKTITSSEFARIQRLRLALDSLAKTKSGKMRLDSLLQKHPKLLDTIIMIESIYHNQNKKSVYEQSTKWSSAKTKGTPRAAPAGYSFFDDGFLGHGRR